LWISASYGDAFRPDERFIALTEAPGDYNYTSAFKAPFAHEYVYCGSPLYGDLSPQRMREWMTYHNHFFRERAFFILYDAGISTNQFIYFAKTHLNITQEPRGLKNSNAKSE